MPIFVPFAYCLLTMLDKVCMLGFFKLRNQNKNEKKKKRRRKSTKSSEFSNGFPKRRKETLHANERQGKTVNATRSCFALIRKYIECMRFCCGCDSKKTVEKSLKWHFTWKRGKKQPEHFFIGTFMRHTVISDMNVSIILFFVVCLCRCYCCLLDE